MRTRNSNPLSFLTAMMIVAVLAVIPFGQLAAQEAARHVPYFGRFVESPLSEISPGGWLRDYLSYQRDGLTGHLEAAGHPFNSTGWYGTTMAKYGWVVYEQNAYWVDGMMRCGALIDDSALVARAMKQINYVLENADSDGYLGPKFLKAHSDLNRWPHVVFFRAMMAEFEKTGDPRIPEALRKHYLSGTDPHTSHRNVINVEIMLWTYAQTHDARLLRMAEECYAEYNRISPEVTTLARMRSDERMDNFHGVTFNETAKLAAVLYLYTGKKEYLKAVEHAYEKVDRYYMLLDGVLSSTEGMRGIDPLESHETCDIADYTWSLGYLLMATGNADYADKIERACFNAAPGAVTKDFKALQYFSCPNQVIADRTSNHNEFFQGSAWMSYRPNPGTECCPGNVNRIMPDYVSRMWMTDSTGAPTAALFGPSRFSFKVGQAEVTIREETAYPFEDEVRFTIESTGSTRFPFVVRIPGWCSNAEITIQSGKDEATSRPPAGRFERIERTFLSGDKITLRLPMHLKLSDWPEGGIGLERGPLVYALPIPATSQVDTLDRKSTPAFPAWNLEPDGPWNYALALPDADIASHIRVAFRQVQGYPWEAANAPVELRVPARRVKGWKLEADSTRPGSFYTPHLPLRSTLADRLSKDVDTLTLIPYGCTLLRESIFPLAGDFARVTGRVVEPECMVPNHVGEDSLTVRFYRESPDAVIHYTLDGKEPTQNSAVYQRPFRLTRSATVSAKAFHATADPSFVATTTLVVLHRLPAASAPHANPGMAYSYFEGKWDVLPDFSKLTPKSSGAVSGCTFASIRHREENWAAVFRGYLDVPQSGVYRFFLTSDDGSMLVLDGTRVVENDGAHAPREKTGYALLDAGTHRIALSYFQGTGGATLSLEVVPPGQSRQPVPESWYHHE
ncbi:MAG: PA14 domain-containing protein [Bacteroidota bacterium]